MTKITKPTIVKDEHLEYLDGLRKSDVTNMWGAGTYIQSRFNITEDESTIILIYWMNSFTERNK